MTWSFSVENISKCPFVPKALRAMSLLGVLLVATACQPSHDHTSAGTSGDQKPTVYVVNYPLKYFSERVGGQSVSVELPIPSGIDPAFWIPDSATILSYQKADLIMLNGASYAKWVEHATLPAGKLVDTSSKFTDRTIVFQNAITHSHGPEGAHVHSELASTTWLDLELAMEHARSVKDALVKLRPGDTTTFEKGFSALEHDLVALDKEIAAVVARDPTQLLIGSHPVYQYLARRYDLKLKSVHWEPDELPDETMWKSLEAMLKDHPARWMIWEGKPLAESVTRLKTLGIDSVVVSPCGNVPGQGDFLSAMRENLQALKQVFPEP